MNTDKFTIGYLAKETGCKIQTIRYYEQIGILPVPERTAGNQRRYGPRHVQQLTFIRHSRQLGFPLESIRQMMSLEDNPDQSCGTVDQIARSQLLEVQSRIERLQSLKVELIRMVEQCRGGQIADCRVLEVLSDHAHCLHENHLESG